MQAVGSLITRTYTSSVSVLMKFVIPFAVIGLLSAVSEYLLPASSFVADEVSVSAQDAGMMFVFGLFMMAVGVYTYYLYYSSYYLLETKSKKASFVKYIFVNIGIGLITAFATLFLILPGVYVGIKLSLAQYYYLSGSMSFSQALSKSWNATHGHTWQILGRIIVLCIILMGVYVVSAVIILGLTGGGSVADVEAPVTALQAFGTGLMSIVALKLGIMSFIYIYHIAKELKKA